MSRRQMQIEGLNLGLTSAELKQINKMSDLRTRPAKSPQDENAQIARLMSNEIILQKIIKKYRDLSTKGGRDAVGIVFGVHKQTIDKLLTMRRTGWMSNVYGALDSTVLDVTVDPYAIATSAVTQLSFSSLETPQNQTRDITKILKKKLPVATGNDELVFPFDSTLFTAPLNYLAKTAFLISLGQAVIKAVGVQWSFSGAKPISAGCICVLGSTKLLQDEATTDPKALTSLDTPTMVLAKWKVTMTPAVAYAGFTPSFGHAALSFDSATGKYSGSNASKINLGLITSTTLNVFWNLNMPSRPFANVASCAYVRSRVVIDARDIEITRNPEGTSSISFYHQIYKPVIRICGGAFVSNAYSGLICPISRLTVISNESRNIIGRAQNGDPYNVIDSIVTLNTELITFKEVVNILSCTATADSWLITTDNQYSALQVVATPAYNPTTINALNKASPVFLSTTSITSSDDWQVATGWRISYSTYYQLKTFQLNSWQANKIEEFFMSVAHIPYKYWRITITLIKTTGVAIHTSISDISFISGNSYGVVVSMVDTPVDWQFNLLLIKNGRIVNSGLYNLSLTTGVTKLS
ncbi:hypothetical protein T492DRAFT_831594 [Pavlovales sp. CCMP2436]|nr:hypothetical protein T492DRAFT_831594 [Pavlovales sp. CCMP2436]